MPHRESIRAWLNQYTFEKKSIVDWGCGTKPIKNYIKHKDCEFFTIDKLRHVGADLVTDIDLSSIELKKQFDIAFCLEVLEHVHFPHLVLENIYANLRMGGMLYLSVPFLYDVHSDEDLWRYTDQGLAFLLESHDFQVLKIDPTENRAGWIVEALKVEKIK